jgi:hypothetical protein
MIAPRPHIGGLSALYPKPWVSSPRTSGPGRRHYRPGIGSDPAGTVFEAIHRGRPDLQLLAYQYLQTLPKLANGDGNHTWLIPSELTRARRVRVRVR